MISKSGSFFNTSFSIKILKGMVIKMEKDFDGASASLETVEFDNRWPCRLRRLYYRKPALPYPHYASTVEIMLISGLSAKISIGARHYQIYPSSKAVFFVAPNTVHYTEIQPSESGEIAVFKISLELMAVYMNLDVLLRSSSHTLGDIPVYLPDNYDTVYDIICNRISYDGDVFAMLGGVLELFRYLDAQISRKNDGSTVSPTNKKICRIIAWMEKNFLSPVTVDDAARELHYSKYYFCKIFKENVGISFLQYLNILRINHAIRLMENGKNATECCYECGFQSFSHFLKLFRKVTGYTTSEYRRVLSEQGNGRYNEKSSLGKDPE